MTKQQKSLGKSESQVLQYILEQGSISVGEVAKHFSESHGLARTTVLTMMERLRKKGFLVRKEHGGVYEYSSKLPREAWLKNQITDFVETTLGGLVSPLVAYLVESKISHEEMAQLEKIVQGISEKGRERHRE